MPFPFVWTRNDIIFLPVVGQEEMPSNYELQHCFAILTGKETLARSMVNACHPRRWIGAIVGWDLMAQQGVFATPLLWLDLVVSSSVLL